MKITTKTGDKGETGLFAGGRVGKDSEIIRLLGELDELQVSVGCAKVVCEEYADFLEQIQQDLYRMMGIVGFKCKPPMEMKDFDRSEVEWLEARMKDFDEEVGELNQFILPGKNEQGARLHTARVICRRAEREFVACKSVEHQWCLKYLNRLSDLLFVLAYVKEKC